MTVFFEKIYDGCKMWEYEINSKIPCTEEEKKIYEVEFKNDLRARNPVIIERKFSDDGIFYEVYMGYMNSTPPFRDLLKAQEYVVKTLSHSPQN